MKKIRLFLIDSNLAFLERVAEYLSTARDVEVVGYTVDVKDALSLISRAQPDCIVTGLALRSCYGLSLLRALRAIPYQPALIVYTSFSSETVLQLARDAGADMFLSKPAPLAHLHECVVSTTRTKRRILEEMRALDAGSHAASATSRIHRALTSAGISARLYGFACLSEALYLLMEDERLLRNLRRNLYPRIAQALGKSPESIERNMRTAILHAAQAQEAEPVSNQQFLRDMLGILRKTGGKTTLTA